MSNKQNDLIIACNPSAIDAADWDEHVALAKYLFSSSTIQEIKELPDGYAFRLPLEASMLYKIADYIDKERLCCPFFTFRMVVSDQLWLELSGSPEVKEVIQNDILQIVETGVLPSQESLQETYDALTGQ
ncbi:MAG: hypothetical protein U0528_17880 [Anaerolineae bacterium]